MLLCFKSGGRDLAAAAASNGFLLWSCSLNCLSSSLKGGVEDLIKRKTFSSFINNEKEEDKDEVEVHGDLGGSPYTYKVVSALRYRRIPHVIHQLLPGGFDLEGNWERLGLDHLRPKVIPVLKSKSHDLVLNDSTFILKEMEKKDLHLRGRSLYPNDPTYKFLALLMEDFFDEWLVKVMFGLRWTNPSDAKWSSQFLFTFTMMGKGQDLAPIRDFSQMFASRQIERMKIVGSTNEEMLWITLRKVAAIMDQFVNEGSLFLFGDRPSVADMALYGQASQFLVDTSSEKVIREEFPSFYAYLRKMADLSGVEGTRWNEDDLSSAANQFLLMASESYLPYLEANYRAIKDGKDHVSVTVYDKTGTPIKHSQPPIKYQAKCLDWLRDEYQQIPEKTKINDILTSHHISPNYFIR